MYTSHLTFLLFFALLIFGIPEAYGLTSYYGLAVDEKKFSQTHERERGEALNKHVYIYTKCATKRDHLYNIYWEAVRLRNDPLKSYLALCDLKGKMGMYQKWDFLLVRTYVGLVNKENETAIDMPDVLVGLVVKFLENDYQATENKILHWCVRDKQWGFISNWLAEGMDHPALCRDTDFLKKYANNLYTYDNNFLNKRLLQWLSHKKKWPVPTDAAIANVCGMKGVYKMRCIQFLQDGNTFLYDLQCVHILNNRIMCYYCENKKERMRTMRAKVIAKNPSFLTPLSYLSSVYWKQKYRKPMVCGNVVCDLVEIILWGIGSIVSAMVIQYSIGFGRLVTLLVTCIIFSIGPNVYCTIYTDIHYFRAITGGFCGTMLL